MKTTDSFLVIELRVVSSYCFSMTYTSCSTFAALSRQEEAELLKEITSLDSMSVI
jgi:hypothetical protein